MYIDMYYIILVLPALVFSIYAQFKVQYAFNRYRRVANARGMTGADVARQILDMNGLHDVSVENIRGNLNDHYDPRTRKIRLSDTVYASQSIAAIGVAAHETGHALQHSTRYAPLMLRNALVPVASFGSGLGPWLAIIGFMLGWASLVQLGILLFAAAVAFTIITLPVEFNATSRAIYTLEHTGILAANEIGPTKKVLKAAALTYVAATAVAVMSLLRFILIANARDD